MLVGESETPGNPTAYICYCGVPPQSPHQDELIEHLISSSVLLCTKYPDIGLAILGDFYRLSVHEICLDNKLSCGSEKHQS